MYIQWIKCQTTATRQGRTLTLSKFTKSTGDKVCYHAKNISKNTPKSSPVIKLSSPGSDWKKPRLNLLGAATGTNPPKACQKRQDRHSCWDRENTHSDTNINNTEQATQRKQNQHTASSVTVWNMTVMAGVKKVTKYLTQHVDDKFEDSVII